jgi:NADH-quinone oxidoreductase E subunit
MDIQFSPENLKEVERLKKYYTFEQGSLLPVLHLAHKEFGLISDDVINYIASLLDIPISNIKDAVSFYTMFNMEAWGRYVIQVCHTLSCALRGAASVVDFLEEKLQIKVGETTADMKFTLIKVECLGSCGTAPVVKINDQYYENMTTERLDQILDNLE